MFIFIAAVRQISNVSHLWIFFLLKSVNELTKNKFIIYLEQLQKNNIIYILRIDEIFYTIY